MKYLLRQADLVKLNQAELTEVMSWFGQADTAASALPWLAAHCGLQAVCLTQGPGGASLWADNDWYHSPGYTATAPAAIGSGRCLSGGIARWLALGAAARRVPPPGLHRRRAHGQRARH